MAGDFDICLVSPSDMAGQINNLLDRVHNLEVAVAQLAGLDVNASNLSDMVKSLGTITNGAIIMPDNSLTGWTTSIPPGDFTGTVLVGGGIAIWKDGVVTFEADQTGIVAGSSNPKFSMRSDMDGTAVTIGGGWTALKWTNPVYDYDTVGCTYSTTTMTFPVTGFYNISYQIQFSFGFNAYTGVISTLFGGGFDDLPWGVQWTVASGTEHFFPSTLVNASAVVHCLSSTNYTLETTVSLSGGSGDITATINKFSAVKMAEYTYS
jgi:hypothetical protein